MAKQNTFSLALDDWGLSPGVNEGILALVDTGCVRSVSLLANQRFLEHGLTHLLRSGVDLTIHLNFTLGYPLRPLGEAKSLCAANGEFFSVRRLWSRAYAGRLNATELRGETSAQLERLRALGIRPTAVEGHHHVHLCGPILRAITATLRDHGVREIRRVVTPNQPLAFLGGFAPSLADWPTRDVHWLDDRDFRRPERLSRKLRAGNRCFVLHPALADDLAEVRCPDPLRARKSQLDGILRHLGRGPTQARLP